MLLNDTLKILSDERRRNIMYILEDSDQKSLKYAEISENLIEQDYMREEEQDRFEVQMQHSLLPQLENSGLLEYDERSETVRYIEDEDVEDLLEFIKQYE